MSDLRSATHRSTLLDDLYTAAKTLLQAVADPIILDEAPLNHRVQALDAIGRFIDRIEKREAAQQPEQEEWIYEPDDKIYEYVIPDTTQEDIDCLVALELASPGRFAMAEGVLERIAYLEQNDPEALERFDKDLARQWARDRRPGSFTRHIWPDGDPHPPTVPKREHTSQGWKPAPGVNPDCIRAQIIPLPPGNGRAASSA